MPIRHAALAALFAVAILFTPRAFAADAGTRYEQVGEHYDVSISYPVLHHPAVDADIARIVWKLTDAFRRVAGQGLPPLSAAGPRNDAAGQWSRGPQPRPGSTSRPAPSPDNASPQADMNVYAPDRRDWLTATHRISRPSANAVSVIFEVQTGLWSKDGAAVSSELLAVSYDLAAGRRIELDDLFGDDDCADAVLAAYLRQRNGGDAVEPVAGSGSLMPAANTPADGRPPKERTHQVALPFGTPPTGQSNAETPVTFWLTPRGLMLLPGSCCWQNASAGGRSSVPGDFPVDARKSPTEPFPAVEVAIEPLLQCAPHLSYWGRSR